MLPIHGHVAAKSSDRSRFISLHFGRQISQERARAPVVQERFESRLALQRASLEIASLQHSGHQWLAEVGPDAFDQAESAALDPEQLCVNKLDIGRDS